MTLSTREFSFFSLFDMRDISYITLLGFNMNCFPPEHLPNKSLRPQLPSLFLLS